MIKKYLKFGLLFSFILAQGEFQICTIPENAFMLSNKNGFSALQFKSNPVNNVKMDIIYFPSNINYMNIEYQKYSFSILDYGKLIDQIDNNIIDTFNSYELILKYNYQKQIKNIFTLKMNTGILYSQISNYNSSALTSDFKFYLNNKPNIVLSLNNIGFILEQYTSNHQKMPIQMQLGILKNINNSEITMGYDLIYHTNIKKYEHILCMQIPIINEILFRISSSNFREELLTGDLEQDWFYGFGYGLSIHSKNIHSDIGISSLGDSGLIYGFSIQYDID